MKRVASFAVAAAGALLTMSAASAHHSFAAEFDRDLPITVTGTVTKVEWMNPHARFYVDAKDEKSGETVNWDFELASPNGLMRRGWNRNSLPAGTKIKVQGFQAKDGSFRANGRDITFADGSKLFVGSSGIGAPDERPE